MKSKIEYKDPQKFVNIQFKLLSQEREAEVERNKDLISDAECQNLSLKKAADLERKGLGLRKLNVKEWTTSSFGKHLLTLEKRDQSDLPASTITTGDIVGLYNETQTTIECITAVVTAVSSKILTVSLDDITDSIDQEASYFLAKLANDVTYKRLKNVLRCIEKWENLGILHNFLFAQSELSTPSQGLNPKLIDENGCLRFKNSSLNDSQKEAIEFALKQKELAVIHGPPGTGKTTTIVELITQEVKQGCKVLVCAPSNVAVDNLLEKLASNKIRVIRIGHPARVANELQKYSLDAQLSLSEQKQLATDVKNDMDKVLSKLKKSNKKWEKSDLSKEMRQLRKEMHQRESRAMKETLKSAEVVLATLTSASHLDGPLKHLPEAHFDLAVIDECSQALEMACWIPLVQVKKVVLAGDHLQLPPTIMSEAAANKGLAYTLMERVINENQKTVRMLNIQYRMNEAIMNWSSQHFYQGKLTADSSVQSRLLKDFLPSDENTSEPLVLIDTTGCDMFELVTEDEQSKANEGEAALVSIYVEQLVSEAGLDPSDIAVITPYNLQVELIRLQLREKYPHLEIRSVDGFQGREKEVVILSLVRSNPQGEVGFLAEPRRLNVAITRAKRHVAVIADVETLQKSKDETLKGLAEYFEAHGQVRSAMQYQHLVNKIDIARPEGLELTLRDSMPREISRTASSCNGAKSKAVAEAPNKERRKAATAGAAIKKENTATSSEKMKEQKQEESPKEEQQIIEDDEDTRAQNMRSIIDQFLEDVDAKTFHCPANLNTYERMLLHELADQAGLGHASQGEGKKRHLVLSKKSTDEIFHKNEAAAAGSSKTSNTTNVVSCSTCAKEVPKVNIELHKLKCTPMTATSLHTAEKPKKSSKSKKKVAQQEEEDIDKLIATFDKIDNVCNLQGCKVKIATLGVQCEHCRLRFCIGHGLPEAHGCGDAARKAARMQIARDGQLYPGSGKPNHKPDPVKKAQLQRKLDKKLEDMQQTRAAKKQTSKKK